jgi:hypothetical membrane protein
MRRDSRANEYGGLFFVFGVVVITIAMLLAQINYPCAVHGCYNILTNAISDLGNTTSSPLWPLFNYALAIFAVLIIIGLYSISEPLFYGAFGRIGKTLLLVSALVVMGIGIVPENTIPQLHSLFSLAAFIFGGVGVLVVGACQFRRGKHTTYAVYSVVSAMVALGAVFVISFPSLVNISMIAYYGPGFGFGGIERIITFPLFIWTFITGILEYFKKLY